MTKLLVTGGAGFIGHHFIDYVLKHTDWDIVSLDRLDFSGNLNRLHEVVMGYPEETRKRVKVVFHDLKAELNPQLVKALGDIDYIAHIAAGSHVDRSIEYPMEFVMDNVVGTCNILEYARLHCPNLKRFIYFSTDEIFGPAPEGVKYGEYDRYNSTNPYSASKAGGEELAVAYQNTYRLPIVITHTMNVFGERQHPEKYIPKIIRSVRDGEELTIHANRSLTKAGSRHYIHAEDVASAVLFLLHSETIDNYLKWSSNASDNLCPKFNIVGPEEYDNLELAHLIADSMNKGLMYNLVDFHSARPGHDLRYALDGTKMKVLGWEPKPIKDRLLQTVEWTLENNRWL